MWLTDILNALYILESNGMANKCCIAKIENNTVYFTSGSSLHFQDIKELTNLIEFKKRMKNNGKED